GLSDLIREGRARIIGAVRQELLSGIKVPEQYQRLRIQLRAFPDEPISTSDYESAANACDQFRSKGIAASPIDSLICAVALDRQWSVFTTDSDFEQYARVLPVKLHSHHG
ncbi:MAG: PIN domain-containing protein, partial [Bryobacteraceae bacterium]